MTASNADDLNIFENDDKPTDCGVNIDECLSLKRITKGLEYYSLLDIVNNENDQEIYTHFIKEVYNQIMNDYTHVITVHHHQLREIESSLINDKKSSFKPCVLSKCNHASRHYASDNDENKENENTLDPVLHLSKQTMDALHFYFFHLFECGLRNIISDDDDRKDGDEVDSAYVDAAFGRLLRRIDETRAKTAHFGRFKVGAKFNIEVDVNDDNIKKERKGKQTFLDGMMKYLVSIGVQDKDIKEFSEVLNDNGYDTDALKSDLNNECNILDKVKHKTIQTVLTAAQIQSSSLNVGLRFYYWIYYKDLKALPAEDQSPWNIETHSGYNICDLYVIAKYASFKEEMGTYPSFCMKQYNEVVLVKVNAFKDTEILRKKQRYKKSHNRTLHYDIEEGMTLSDGHLCALILYTDFSDLSAAFTRSFRKKSVFEPLSSIKRRNSAFWWLSKKLREAVECFGSCDFPDRNLSGPFYSGMKCVMIIPEFDIRLYSPTSTSKHIEIAMQFSGRYGIIIQLNNESGGKWDDHLRGFDCSWFSRYPEEDERLFCGGYYPAKLESVRIIETKQNFHDFFRALYYLDAS